MTAVPASHRFCVAPMLDWTDRHERYFLRLVSRHARLYTEMITAGALLHGDAPRFLRFDDAEHPVAIQLGGSDPAQLARCAQMAAAAGYDEINLNVGCPSDRVQSGRFGACLMAEPALVAECVSAMQQASDVLVSVKSRIGIDELDSDDFLFKFIDTVASEGCRDFIVHARIAILKGLSPKQNREVPPLNYARVHRLKRRFPELNIVINGGICSLDSAREALAQVDGVMVGREAYQNPWLLADVDSQLFGADEKGITRESVIAAYLPYVSSQLAEGVPLQHMTRHILGLFREVPGARQFRRYLSEHAHRPGAGVSVLEDALALTQRCSWQD